MTFVDSNVFVYSVDKRNPEKRRIAREIIAAAIDNHDFTISQQVLMNSLMFRLKSFS